MTKAVTIFHDGKADSWAWKTRRDEAAIEDLMDLWDCLLEECNGATRLVVIDKQGKTHKGPKALKALPSFGGTKPRTKGAVSWDGDEVIVSKGGRLELVERT